MAIGTPYAATANHFPSSASSNNFTLSATPTSGDMIIVYVYRTSEGSTGTFPTATITGYTSKHHHDPLETYRGVIDILVKESDGTETGAQTVTFNETANGGHCILAAVWPNVSDVSAVSVNYPNPSTTVTVNADTGDGTVHCIGNQLQDIDQSTDFPSGDTLIGWARTASQWRSAGWATSGGGTVYGTFPSATYGTWTNLTLTESAGSATPTVEITTIADGAEIRADFDLTSLECTVTGTEDIDNAEYRLQRDSDSFWWTGSAWQSGAATVSISFGQANLPATITFSNGPTNLDVDESETYTLEMRAQNISDTWSTWDSVEFDTRAWVNASDVDFNTVAAAGDPSVLTTTNAADGDRLVSTTTSFTLEGTATNPSETITAVEVATDPAGPWNAATNTGTNFSTWEYEFTGLTAGDVLDIYVRAVT